MTDDLATLLSLERLQAAGTGPLYVKLRRTLEGAVRTGTLGHGDALPPERDIAELAAVSRVTVRKAIDELVADGLLVRRHGSGTFVAKPVSKVEQRLSQLTSFTEDMARRGMSSRSEWLHKGIHTPSPDEMMILGLGRRRQGFAPLAPAHRRRPAAGDRACQRLRRVPARSLRRHQFALCRARTPQVRPVRAVQRISATNMKEADAQLLGVSAGAAGLSIERISYLGLRPRRGIHPLALSRRRL